MELSYCALLALTTIGCSGDRPVIRVANVGRFDFAAGPSNDPRQAVEGLSGITYMGGGEYLAVSDRHAFLHRLSIRLDRESGAVKAVSLGTPLQLKDAACRAFPEPDQGPDREGLAYDARSQSVWVTNERTGTDDRQPSIARHSIDSGCMVDQLRMSAYPELRAFGRTRRNFGFEALARDPENGALWTANEEALPVDGRRATGRRGTVVRLLQLDADLRPLGQYAYVTDPLPASRRPDTGLRWASGVSEIVALPGGRLIVLERARIETEPGAGAIRIRLFQVNVLESERLTSSALTTGLEKASYTAVAKSRLIQLEFDLNSNSNSNSNFEGATLGPRLTNGDYSLLLIADNGAGLQQSLYALRLSGLRD